MGRTSPVPYTLVDLAEDVRGLLDHLGIERAHVVGASMGGMIAQVLAGSHPDRLASLGLIMSSSGRPFSAVPRWRVIKLAFDPPAKDAPAEDKLAVEVRNISVINGPNFLPPDDATAPPRRGADRPQRLPAGHAAPVRRDPGHRQPAALHPPHHRTDGRHPRLRGSDDAAAKRAQPGPGHRRRTLRGGRRHGSRPARAGVAPGHRSAHRELPRRPGCSPLSRPCAFPRRCRARASRSNRAQRSRSGRTPAPARSTPT